jgi:hypothetical protein
MRGRLDRAIMSAHAGVHRLRRGSRSGRACSSLAAQPPSAPVFSTSTTGNRPWPLRSPRSCRRCRRPPPAGDCCALFLRDWPAGSGLGLGAAHAHVVGRHFLVVSRASSYPGVTQMTPSRRLARDMATLSKLNASVLARREQAAMTTRFTPSLAMSFRIISTPLGGAQEVVLAHERPCLRGWRCSPAARCRGARRCRSPCRYRQPIFVCHGLSLRPATRLTTWMARSAAAVALCTARFTSRASERSRRRRCRRWPDPAR